MPRFQLSINDQQREYEVIPQGNRLHLIYEDATLDVIVTPLVDGDYLLEYEDPAGFSRRIHLAGRRSADKRQLWVDGRTLVATRLRRESTTTAATDTILASSIPAVVSQILVSEGDIVAAGDKLILLESMKMVIPIQAPAAGRVVKINCAAGDSVPAGLLLMELEPL